MANGGGGAPMYGGTGKGKNPYGKGFPAIAFTDGVESAFLYLGFLHAL